MSYLRSRDESGFEHSRVTSTQRCQGYNVVLMSLSFQFPFARQNRARTILT